MTAQEPHRGLSRGPPALPFVARGVLDATQLACEGLPRGRGVGAPSRVCRGLAARALSGGLGPLGGRARCRRRHGDERDGALLLARLVVADGLEGRALLVELRAQHVLAGLLTGAHSTQHGTAQGSAARGRQSAWWR